MLSANFKPKKQQLRHRAVPLRQHGFLVCVGVVSGSRLCVVSLCIGHRSVDKVRNSLVLKRYVDLTVAAGAALGLVYLLIVTPDVTHWSVTDR